MIKKKICMLGSFSVGKTSLVRRKVDGIFSDKYLTTVGVKIDNLDTKFEDQKVKLVLWDIHGDDEFQRIQASYLRGSAGFFFVVDGTRLQTMEHIFKLKKMTDDVIPDASCIVLINKYDLKDDLDWLVDDEYLNKLKEYNLEYIYTSAKDNLSVDSAFEGLLKKMI